MASRRSTPNNTKKTTTKRSWGTYFKWMFGIGISAAFSGCFLALFIFGYTYSQLPELDTLTEYRPKIPLRIWSADGKLIGEFGEERRDFVPIEKIPDTVKKAILAAEDDGFYEHPGVEFTGIARAAIVNILTGRRGQGGSTITQQVARNFFLTTKRTYTRKLYEIAMSFKIEQELTKDQILEIYINQIYLGERAYGFSSAARTYFGRSLDELSIGEAATLAGLPVAPSAYNPIKNISRATMRKNYVLRRMYDLGYIDEITYVAAKNEPMQVRRVANAEEKIKENLNNEIVSAKFAAELARMLVYDIFKDETYSRGINVYTTIDSKAQQAAVKAVQEQLIKYDRKYGYRGPEGFVDLSKSRNQAKTIRQALSKVSSSPSMVPAVVTKASPKELQVAISATETITLDKESLRFGRYALSAKPSKKVKPIRVGSIVRIMRSLDGKGWTLAQKPEVETAFVAANFNSGAIQALVGGFDFNLNKFNHVTQARRQPGSSFKPFIYSAALDKGFSRNTIINDAPIYIDPKLTGNRIWEPKNYDRRFDGPMTLTRALTRSKNLVTIRIMQAITPRYAQEFITKFGFDPQKHPANLPMSLGAGSVTPWELMKGYAVFANGGYLVQPYLIDRVTDNNGRTLMRATNRRAGDESIRSIDRRNAYIMHDLLNRVATKGTARKATLQLKRPDIGGKTGTTNDSHDAWFAGYAGTQVAVGWVGYDTPKPLGSSETGGGLALPIWINYMKTVLKDQPPYIRVRPESVTERDNYLFYSNPVRSSGTSLLTPEDQNLIRDQIF